MELGVSIASRDDAIRRAGALLRDSGAVEADYVERMLEREHSVSTFVGDGVAMPHATRVAADSVKTEGLCLLTLTEPVDWAGQPVSLVIGIAAVGRRNITLLSELALVLLDEARVEGLRAATTAAQAQELLVA
jgi:PTS system mannitol-specific IIA component